MESQKTEVGEDKRPDTSVKKTEPAKEMLRATAIVTRRQNGKKGERASRVAFETITRSPMLTRPMGHDDLTDAASLQVGENRNEAMASTVELSCDLCGNFGPHELIITVYIVQTNPGAEGDDVIEDS
ncbi:MAG: hypothetical protein J6386_16820 [Candidatus Synoicihabitans palmerolidicus]|nr:hypothetical protein [Candidatus Synoicihabitans palmerolidicus]